MWTHTEYDHWLTLQDINSDAPVFLRLSAVIAIVPILEDGKEIGARLELTGGNFTEVVNKASDIYNQIKVS